MKSAENTCPGDARRSQGYSGSGQGIGVPHAVGTGHLRWTLCLFLSLSL